MLATESSTATPQPSRTSPDHGVTKVQPQPQAHINRCHLPLSPRKAASLPAPSPPLSLSPRSPRRSPASDTRIRRSSKPEIRASSSPRPSAPSSSRSSASLTQPAGQSGGVGSNAYNMLYREVTVLRNEKRLYAQKLAEVKDSLVPQLTADIESFKSSIRRLNEERHLWHEDRLVLQLQLEEATALNATLQRDLEQCMAVSAHYRASALAAIRRRKARVYCTNSTADAAVDDSSDCITLSLPPQLEAKARQDSQEDSQLHPPETFFATNASDVDSLSLGSSRSTCSRASLESTESDSLRGLTVLTAPDNPMALKKSDAASDSEPICSPVVTVTIGNVPHSAPSDPPSTASTTVVEFACTAASPTPVSPSSSITSSVPETSTPAATSEQHEATRAKVQIVSGVDNVRRPEPRKPLKLAPYQESNSPPPSRRALSYHKTEAHWSYKPELLQLLEVHRTKCSENAYLAKVVDMLQSKVSTLSRLNRQLTQRVNGAEHDLLQEESVASLRGTVIRHYQQALRDTRGCELHEVQVSVNAATNVLQMRLEDANAAVMRMVNEKTILQVALLSMQQQLQFISEELAPSQEAEMSASSALSCRTSSCGAANPKALLELPQWQQLLQCRDAVSRLKGEKNFWESKCKSATKDLVRNLQQSRPMLSQLQALKQRMEELANERLAYKNAMMLSCSMMLGGGDS